jgi:GNAT superfamily N-acetyltransferase
MRPASGAATLAVAGGFAAFHAIGSPLSQAVGLGMEGPVSSDDLDAVEEFFRSRGNSVVLHVCPLADPTLLELVSRRGYRISEFNTVLVRPMVYGEMIPSCGPGTSVRRARADEADDWARLMLHGFLGRELMSEPEYRVGSAIFHSSMAWIAESDGEALGAAAFSVHEGLACFFADSTLPPARNRGAHTALIRARLRRSQERGCDLATATTQPGSASQRNYELCGFRVAYTKAIAALG